jgi:hypothetical protein
MLRTWQREDFSNSFRLLRLIGNFEVKWSIPSTQLWIIEQQNIFDGTWTNEPSLSWILVPLTEYYGGGAAASSCFSHHSLCLFPNHEQII